MNCTWSCTTPAPTLTFTAASTSLPYNGSTTLSWSSTNATACTASNGWTGAKAVNGSQSTGALTANITYTLTCTGPGGSIARTVSISVAGPAYVDCAFYVRNTGGVIAFSCQPPATLSSPLRIKRSGGTYGVVLVPVTDPNATAVRIRTGTGVMALRKF